jgi:hypothetical protein
LWYCVSCIVLPFVFILARILAHTLAHHHIHATPHFTTQYTPHLKLSYMTALPIVHLLNTYCTSMSAYVRTRTLEFITALEITRVLDSISDNNAYLSFNVRPVERALALLQANFNPNTPPDQSHFSLELSRRPAPQNNSSTRSSFSSIYGYSQRYFGQGACLTHDHRTQYTFVYQSLCLWREIMSSMPRLWLLADSDMLMEYYRLSDTGQGFHRYL